MQDLSSLTRSLKVKFPGIVSANTLDDADYPERSIHNVGLEAVHKVDADAKETIEALRKSFNGTILCAQISKNDSRKVHVWVNRQSVDGVVSQLQA